MRLRRTAVLLAAVSGLLVGVAGPSFAANPIYPPIGGGGGSGLVVTVDRTLSTVHGSALVTVYNCSASTATLTVIGPGRPPGVPSAPYTVSITNGTGSTTVTFDRVGRNIINADCAGTMATAFAVVKPTTPAGVKTASVLGETIHGAGAATSGALGAVTAGAASAVTAVGELVKTGADATGPLLIAMVLLMAGGVLLLVSRPRRRVTARASGRHRG